MRAIAGAVEDCYAGGMSTLEIAALSGTNAAIVAGYLAIEPKLRSLIKRAAYNAGRYCRRLTGHRRTRAD